MNGKTELKLKRLRLPEVSFWGGILILIIFILIPMIWYSWPRGGSAHSVEELREVVRLPKHFELLPVKPVFQWKVLDPLLQSYRVFGKLPDVESYGIWRFGADRIEGFREIILESQEGDKIIVGAVGDQYFKDQFEEDGRLYTFHVLRSGEFYLDIHPIRK